MKARVTNESVDMEQMHERFASLSPLIGMTVQEMEEAYQKAQAVSRLASADIPGGGVSLDNIFSQGEEGAAGAFTSFVAELLTHLGDRKSVAALQKTRLYFEEQQLMGVEPHPLVQLIHGIALMYAGSHEKEALAAFTEAARSSVSPTYTFIARFALALFSPRADLPGLLAMLREAAAGASSDHAPLGAMMVALLDIRYADEPALRERVMQDSAFRSLLEGMGSAAEEFPKTVAAMGSGERRGEATGNRQQAAGATEGRKRQ
jgi:hypothetical protein